MNRDIKIVLLTKFQTGKIHMQTWENIHNDELDHTSTSN